jgi:hypothetical protein
MMRRVVVPNTLIHDWGVKDTDVPALAQLNSDNIYDCNYKIKRSQWTSDGLLIARDFLRKESINGHV